MIICGYQGIGKSTISGIDYIVDLESAMFFNHETNNRPKDWYVYYCQLAEYISKQGYTVLISSHRSVREFLEHSTEKVYVVFPDISLESDWIDKLQSRYDEDNSHKNQKALLNAKCSYSMDIMEMAKGKLPTYIITDMNYSLYKIIVNLRKV